jgi:hypothetical protein
VSETLLEALVDMRHYIKCGIEPAESCPACVRYDALQVEVMKAIGEIEKLRAELAEARNRISQLEAARIGYAKEFPVDDEGLPDAGSIHQNIRKLKAELAEARRERDRLREAVEQAPHAPTCQSLYIDIVGGLREPFSFEGLRHVARPCNCWKRAALEGKP